MPDTPPTASTSSATLAAPTEATPLLKRSPSASSSQLRLSVSGVGDEEDEAKAREVEVYHRGKSNFWQTLLNTLGDIIGTGLLACPIAFAHAGWILGPILLILIAGITLWTLKILLRIIEKDRRLRSFTDVIGYGLGPTGQKWVTILFIFEVGAWIIALVVLFSDTLEAVLPIFSSDQWKIIGLAVIIPTSFVPLRFLSFSSALGITSTWTLVGILIFTGIATPESPGSLRDPAQTDLLPSHGWAKLATVLGLLLSGFGGHGLIPNLIHDMKNPKQADCVCEAAYGIAMVVYLVVSVCGYLMYGTNVSDEISKDLATTPGFSPLLQKMAVWMVALNPLTKIPLGIRPLSDIVYTYFDLHPKVLVPAEAPTPYHATRPSSPSGRTPSPSPPALVSDAAAESHIRLAESVAHARHERLKSFLRPLVRVGLAGLAILGGLALPSFETVLSILGSGFGLVSVVIIPICAYGKVFGYKWWHGVICVLAGIMAVLGTVGAFASSQPVERA